MTMTTIDSRITITSLAYVPMQEDEEPGMPSFHVKGVAGGVPFDGTVSCEIDGRDIEWDGDESLYGALDGEALCLIICEIEGTPVWRAGLAAHSGMWPA